MKSSKNFMEKLLALAKAIPFRKRGGSYMTIAVVMFAAVLAMYLLSGVFQGLEPEMQTVTALEYESSAGCYSVGYIVRSETVLTSASSITSLVLGEGQKAAVGQPVAMGYTSVDAQLKQLQIAKLEDELIQLQYATDSSAAIYDQAAMDAQIRESLMDIAQKLGKGRVEDARNKGTELKGLVLRREANEEDLAAIRTQITSLESEISQLRAQVSGGVKPITAPVSGYFSGTTDGFEAVLTPESITSLSVSQTERLTAGAQQAGAVGKIISGDVWYYLTIIPAEQLNGLKTGDCVTVSFSQELAGSILMTISHISQEENGNVVLALSADHYLQEMTLARQLSADIIFRTYSGLRVPKEAVRVREDGKAGVYILESAAVSWKSVEILHDNGETYIVKLDKTSTANLWPGDEVIVSGDNDLYDGKVVS